jgi:hypothetical protein
MYVACYPKAPCSCQNFGHLPELSFPCEVKAVTHPISFVLQHWATTAAGASQAQSLDSLNVSIHWYSSANYIVQGAEQVMGRGIELEQYGNDGELSPQYLQSRIGRPSRRAQLRPIRNGMTKAMLLHTREDG